MAGTLVLVDGGFTPIEQLDVGDRVITTNNTPDLSATEVDPATWRALDLLMEDPRAPGYAIELTVLRSDTWIEATRAREGGWIHFALPEMGVEGAAHVMGVRPCPPIDDGPGRVVLATIQSTSATVLDLHIEGLAAPLQPTAAHPFYSVDRSDWIPAGQLSACERIRGLLEPVVVTDVTTRVGFHQVYNLEVEADHCYAVSNEAVLTHNTNTCGEGILNRGGRFADLDARKASGEVAHHMAQNAFNRTVGLRRQDGPAIGMTLGDHELTRTMRARGANTMKFDAGLGARQRMTLDLLDLRRNFGRKYNRGALEMIEYAKTLPEYAK